VLDALLYDPNLDVSNALVGDTCLPLTSLDDLDSSLVLGLDDDTIDVAAPVASAITGVLPPPEPLLLTTRLSSMTTARSTRLDSKFQQ
jgi:hypothetical protein